MEWSKLLSNKRKNELEYEEMSKVESELTLDSFSFDFGRIVQSASFRRLQDKTQVYPLEKIDFVRTRLTHSIEVSSIAEEIGQLVIHNLKQHRLREKDINLSAIPVILKSAGLIHDLGNPPFGHFGETVIREWFKNNLSKYSFLGTPVYELDGHGNNIGILSDMYVQDFFNFDGNAHTFRILNRLHFDRGESGMNLTYPVLSAIGKYTVASDNIGENGRITDKKIGYFRSEEDDIQLIANTLGTLRYDYSICRHPLAYIVEAADDIAYRLADLEDTFKKGLVSLSELKTFIRERFEYYKNNNTNMNFTKTEYFVHALEEQSNDDISDYDILNRWIFKVQIHLINAAKFGFTKNYDEIMQGKYNYDLLHNTYHEYTMKIFKDISAKFAFPNKEVNILELSSETIIGYFLDKLVPVLIKYDSDEELSPLEAKYFSLISDNYIKNYQIVKKNLEEKYVDQEEELIKQKLYHRLLISIDFVAGMTDSYAKRLYRELNGI